MPAFDVAYQQAMQAGFCCGVKNAPIRTASNARILITSNALKIAHSSTSAIGTSALQSKKLPVKLAYHRRKSAYVRAEHEHHWFQMSFGLSRFVFTRVLLSYLNAVM